MESEGTLRLLFIFIKIIQCIAKREYFNRMAALGFGFHAKYVNQ